jgi:hypothetical protein
MKEENFSPIDSLISNASPHSATLRLFQHQDLLEAKDTDRLLDLKKLINKLNYINFTNGHIFFILHHRNGGAPIVMKAYPQPCATNELVSRLEPLDPSLDFKDYEVSHLMADDGLSVILAGVHAIHMEGDILKTNLPDVSTIKTLRRIKRFICDDVSCKILQGDFNAQGDLVDFSPKGLGIRLAANKNMKSFDESKPAVLNLHQNGNKLYTGLCRCIRNGLDSTDGKMVFSPLPKQVSLFPKREIRNSRQHIAPSFSVRFKHPFFKGYIERDLFDISSSGFSIKDKMEEELLLPEMLIRDMTIIYAGIVKMKCSAQVVYRHEEPENNLVKCGLAISDMDIESFTNLNQILGVTDDSNAGVSSDVDMDTLWEFFFDTGFIYGEKYESIQSYRDAFKETYRKLYQDSPNIARHIVYKKNGRIYGHIAMVHAYEPSWLIHHFAARRMSHRLPGVTVLRQITQYISSYNRLPSAGMDHVMTYYQPDNKVIDRIFGEFTRSLDDLRGSSLDLFSYMQVKKNDSPEKLPEGWVLREIAFKDMAVLKGFYEPVSGGLLLSALGLDIPSDSIKKSFADAGFKRDYQTYCLSYQGRQMAFFIVNQSDIKLNLSDLINGIKVIIVEPDILSWAMLSSAVNHLGGFFTEQIIPLLIFPSHYLTLQNIPVEKQYALWILQLRNASDEYLAHVNKIMKLQRKGNP